MPKRPTQIDAKSAVELLEEAVHLLRASGGAVGFHLLGTMPFALGILFFIADMSRSTTTAEALLGESLVLAGLFVWMKTWHSLAMQAMLARLCMGQPPRRGARGVLTLIAWQAFIHGVGLILLPLAGMTVVLLPRVHAFLQTASLLADGEGSLRHAIGQAYRQSGLVPGANWRAQAILYLIAAVLFINAMQAILLPPYLMKVFLDIDTVFTRGGFTAMNTTFLSIVGALVFLSLDPVVKAFYTLRCFYGRSRQTGEDLRAQLRQLIAGAAIVLAAWVLLASPAPASAQEAPAPPAKPAPAVSPRELDRSIDKTIAGRKYQWRLPPDQRPQEKGWTGALGEQLRKFREWLFRPRDGKPQKQEEPREDSRPQRPSGGGGSYGPGPELLQGIMYVVLGICAIAIVIVLFKFFRNRPVEVAKAADAAAPAVDLHDEEVSAAQMPEDAWWRMAQDLLAKGDRRLALRAMYLASLAMLGEHGLIRIARFKSNREYQAELARRAHALPEVVQAFGANMGFFEDAWYGMHNVTDDIVSFFCQNQERIRKVGAA